MNSNYKLVCIYPATYDELKQKGVLHLMTEKDENGFFSHVYHVLYPAPASRTMELNSNHTIIETGRYLGFLFNVPGLSYLAVLLNFVFLTAKVILLAYRAGASAIRSQTPYIEGLCALAASWVTGIPFCVSIHSDYDKCYLLNPHGGAPVFFGSRKSAKALERFVLSRTPVVMPIREHLAKYAVSSGASPSSIRVIPHGIDMAPFLEGERNSARKDLGLPQDLKIISFVGRLSRENFILDLIPIAEEVLAGNKDILFTVVGSGPLEKEFIDSIAVHGLGGIFKLYGFQPREKVAKFRISCDISLCLMGGYSLIESAAAARPIVSYDLEWHHEIVENDLTGFLIKQGDVKQAADSITRLLQNKNKAEQMGRNARAKVIEKHSLEKTSQIKIKYYDELISGGTRL